MNDLGFGVCRLSVIAVRADASDKAEQVTQLLFGDHYEVLDLSEDKKWFKIKVHFDQYEGWVDALQHHPISHEFFDYINRTEFKITMDVTSTMLYNKSPMVILIGSIIPISSAELFRMEEQFAFNGEAKTLGQKREYDFLKNVAYKYLHAPYLWGGKSPFGIDCSGFTQMVYKICGYSLLRDARQQANQGKIVKSLAEAKPGDLVFFKNIEHAITHVGILLADYKIIHASGRVRVDVLTNEGIVNTETKMLTHSLAQLRRIFSEHT